MRSLVYVLALVTLTQPAFAGGGNGTAPEKSQKKGFFSKLIQGFMEPDQTTRQYRHEERREEMPPSARAAFQERMRGTPPRPNPKPAQSPQDAFFDSDELSSNTDSTPSPNAATTRVSVYANEFYSDEASTTLAELERGVREDQREIARLEGILAASNREHCRLTELLRTCSQRMTDQERQIEDLKKRQFPRLARLEMMNSTEISAGVSDYLLSQTLISNIRATGGMPIFLAAGNPYHVPDTEGEKQLGVFFRNLPEKAFVIFDADSKAAPAIIQASEGRAILGLSAVVGRTLEGAHVAVITNPYLRMETILASDSITFSPDSVLGLGLQFEAGNKKLFVLQMGQAWTPGLVRWSDSLGPTRRHAHAWYGSQALKNFGISYSFENQPRVLQLEDHPNVLNTFQPRVDTDLDSLVRRADPRVFKDAFEYAKGLRERRQTLASHLHQLGVSETVAFFGSGEGGPEFEDLVQETVSKVSGVIPVVTGGAGGYMLSANRVAAKTPGFSIGIPMGGKKNWHEVTSTGVLHLTVSAVGYEQRIPLIFDQNTASHVLVAPGGMGTMKELATALVSLSSGMNTNPLRIVFIGQTYYGNLVEWIQSLPLPAEISDRMITN